MYETLEELDAVLSRVNELCKQIAGALLGGEQQMLARTEAHIA